MCVCFLTSFDLQVASCAGGVRYYRVHVSAIAAQVRSFRRSLVKPFDHSYTEQREGDVLICSK